MPRSKRELKKGKTNAISTSREVTPPLYTPDGTQLYEVEFVYAARLTTDDEWEYRTKWTNYGWIENTWEPQSSFCLSEETIEEFWRLTEGDPGALDHPLNKTYALTPEQLDAYRLKMSKVTKRSKPEDLPPRSPSPILARPHTPQRGVKLPEVDEQSDMSWEETEGDAYETGSATDSEEEGDSLEPEDNAEPTKPPTKRNRNLKRTRESHPDSTQPYLPVPGSILETKLNLYMNTDYALQHPEDPGRQYKDFSMKTRRNDDSHKSDVPPHGGTDSNSNRNLPDPWMSEQAESESGNARFLDSALFAVECQQLELAQEYSGSSQIMDVDGIGGAVEPTNEVLPQEGESFSTFMGAVPLKLIQECFENTRKDFDTLEGQPGDANPGAKTAEGAEQIVQDPSEEEIEAIENALLYPWEGLEEQILE
ncbi:hypothetical protein E1B28_009634 [Marasmius oreades]|uniref:Chromo domain-containing protein n=1 Tax=Marasmius oreades TaxID=181124 RepID=A0A9P7RVP6_9AGAR|nr:uncharacterized protein E1B28_009634 [Marasmius oreades]KAG7090525.1 hypothetical protein E1B28_009634 [Marasmius oreades]